MMTNPTRLAALSRELSELAIRLASSPDAGYVPTVHDVALARLAGELLAGLALEEGLAAALPPPPTVAAPPPAKGKRCRHPGHNKAPKCPGCGLPPRRRGRPSAEEESGAASLVDTRTGVLAGVVDPVKGGAA